LNVTKVNVAFAGLHHGLHGKPYAKLDALAKARQHRLTERQAANLLLEFFKKREVVVANEGFPNETVSILHPYERGRVVHAVSPPLYNANGGLLRSTKPSFGKVTGENLKDTGLFNHSNGARLDLVKELRSSSTYLEKSERIKIAEELITKIH
jgi:hypothetical protein